MFRKPVKVPFRRKISACEEEEVSVEQLVPPAIPENEVNFDDSDVASSRTISETKAIQRYRRKPRGVTLSTVSTAEVEEEVCGEGGEQDELLRKNFESQGQKTTDKRDPHLEDFLAAKMGKRPTAADDTGNPSVASSLEREKQSLYLIPESLRVEDKGERHSEKMNWVTGLVEVALPIQYKLANIEATEKAKREILKLGAGAKPKDSTSTPTLDNEDIVRKRALGSRFLPWEQHKVTGSTDDQTLDRFRKRVRR